MRCLINPASVIFWYYYGIWTPVLYNRVNGRHFNKGCPYTIVGVFGPTRKTFVENVNDITKSVQIL